MIWFGLELYVILPASPLPLAFAYPADQNPPTETTECGGDFLGGWFASLPPIGPPPLMEGHFLPFRSGVHPTPNF